MKNSFIILLSIISFCALAQTRQNINKNTGTVSNVLTTIDSIRFNGSSTTMEVVLQNGTLESHSISDIQNVKFISSSQHSCGADSVHNPNLNYGSMTDQEGNVYKTIIIGTQEWMAENLKTSIYRNGDIIATNLTDAEWSNTVNTQLGAWVNYNNDSQYDCPYGKLYSWYTVADPRNLCPTGWHVPTDNEWTTLTDYLGGFSVAGNKMKTTGLSYWISNNALATNSSGFSGLLGGYRNYSGSFDNYNDDGCWWSSSSDASYISNSLYLRLNSNYSNADYNSDNKGAGFSVRCLSDIINTVSILPSVITSTNVILNSTENSAVSGGNITSDGGAPVTQRGICWSTSPNPTTSSNTTFDGNGIGSFTSNMTGLSANITYYVRAYAINSVGTAYGNQQIFTTLIASPHSCGANNVHNPNLNYGSMTDQEGNVHKTIVIGTQEWMAENLKTSIYRNGDPIATNLTDVEWGNTSNTNLGAWVYYNNDSQYDCPYGKLYNWYALADPRHVCPSGWHEPTDSEWTSLTDYLGGVAIAGGKMKTTGIQYWDSLNTNATNESGFSGLPGGYYNVSSSLIGTYNYFWSASERNNNTSWYRFLRFNGENIYPYYIQKTQGMSVRCLKD